MKSIPTKGQNRPIYISWWSMIDRCTNPQSSEWNRYGGRGIKVCERWRVFENFFADMGLRANGMTLERKNNDGNYEPGNCVWATWREQAQNRSSTVFATINGEKKCVAEWARTLGVSPRLVGVRMHRGWTPERALTTPKRTHGGTRHG